LKAFPSLHLVDRK